MKSYIVPRYGSPVNAREEYVQFAEWYLATFTGGILETLLRILDQYRCKVYISPRVLQQTISYIDQWYSVAFNLYFPLAVSKALKMVSC